MAKRARAIFCAARSVGPVTRVFILLADGAAGGIGRQHEFDHRIVRGLDGRHAAIPQRLAHGGIAELGLRQARRQVFRRILAQEGLGARRVGGEIFAQLGQPEFQRHLLQFRIDRLRIEQAFCSAAPAGCRYIPAGARHWAWPFPPRRAPGRGRSGTGPSRCRRAPPSCNREDRAPSSSTCALAISLQGSPISAARVAIGRDLGLEIGVRGALGGDQRRIDQRLFLAVIGLEAVLDAEQKIIGDAGMLGAFLGEADQPAAQFGKLDQGLRQVTGRAGVSSCSAVSSRWVEPGLPATKTGSPSLGGAALQFR